MAAVLHANNDMLALKVQLEPDKEVQCFEIKILIHQGDQLVAKDRNYLGKWTSSDPYVIVALQTRSQSEADLLDQGPGHARDNGELQLGRTPFIPKNLSPKWNAEFTATVPMEELTQDSQFVLTLMDHDYIGDDDCMGVVPVHLAPVITMQGQNRTSTKWYGVPALSASRACGRVQCTLEAKICYKTWSDILDQRIKLQILAAQQESAQKMEKTEAQKIAKEESKAKKKGATKALMKKAKSIGKKLPGRSKSKDSTEDKDAPGEMENNIDMIIAGREMYNNEKQLEEKPGDGKDDHTATTSDATTTADEEEDKDPAESRPVALRRGSITRTTSMPSAQSMRERRSSTRNAISAISALSRLNAAGPDGAAGDEQVATVGWERRQGAAVAPQRIRRTNSTTTGREMHAVGRRGSVTRDGIAAAISRSQSMRVPKVQQSHNSDINAELKATSEHQLNNRRRRSTIRIDGAAALARARSRSPTRRENDNEDEAEKRPTPKLDTDNECGDDSDALVVQPHNRRRRTSVSRKDSAALARARSRSPTTARSRSPRRETGNEDKNKVEKVDNDKEQVDDSDTLVVKCLDGSTKEVIDMEKLNEQLHTFSDHTPKDVAPHKAILPPPKKKSERKPVRRVKSNIEGYFPSSQATKDTTQELPSVPSEPLTKETAPEPVPERTFEQVAASAPQSAPKVRRLPPKSKSFDGHGAPAALRKARKGTRRGIVKVAGSTRKVAGSARNLFKKKNKHDMLLEDWDDHGDNSSGDEGGMAWDTFCPTNDDQ